MERLGFSLPEFSRLIWVSEQARTVWSPRFHRISQAWETIEKLAVVAGVREAALQTISPEDLPRLTDWASDEGLVALPLNRQGVSDSGYQNASLAYEDGKPWTYRVVITLPCNARRFIQAWRDSDNDKIGEFLGFPECCREFYRWSWVEQGWRDVVLTSSAREVISKSLQFPKQIYQEGLYQNNVFLRHLGVRLVSHLPCSPDCQDSVEVSEAMSRVAVRSGFLTENAWARDILQWPLKWTSLHGVGIVTTPVVKIVYSTDALSEKVEIQQEGHRYPTEGGRGDFPFRQIVHVANTSKNNGFTNVESMINAHAMIMQGVLSLDIPEGAKIIDLGCGDGQLLETIRDVADVIPVGVESNKFRFQQAVKRLKGKPNQLYCLDIFSDKYWEPLYFLGLVSVQRFFEATDEKAKELLRRLKVSCEHVIFYSYLSDQWTGYLGMTNSFVVEKFLTGPSSCAALMRPMKSDEKEVV